MVDNEGHEPMIHHFRCSWALMATRDELFFLKTTGLEKMLSRFDGASYHPFHGG
jgi:hypothetical protein